jgi:hypothetical protein
MTTAAGGGTYKRVIGYDWDPNQLNRSGGVALEAHHFTTDEIAHWSPIPDPNASFRGMSWLTPILKEIRADNGLTFYKTMYLERGQPVVAVKYAQRFRPETVDLVVERIMARYGGSTNAFKPLILDQGADPIIGAGLKDLDLTAIAAGGEERICAAGGVPPEIVGLREAQGDKYAPAMRRFADLTCRPLWRSACAALEKFVSVPQGSRLWYDTTDIAALQAAETERAQVVQVSAAATLTFVQAGFERKSIIAAVTSGDLSLLKPDPNAPTPGVVERETVAVGPMGEPVTGPESGTQSGISAASGKQGVPPGGGALLTQPQTAATKAPMPGSIPTAKTGNGKAAKPPSVNK